MGSAPGEHHLLARPGRWKDPEPGAERSFPAPDQGLSLCLSTARPRQSHRPLVSHSHTLEWPHHHAEEGQDHLLRPAPALGCVYLSTFGTTKPRDKLFQARRAFVPKPRVAAQRLPWDRESDFLSSWANSNGVAAL